MKISQLVDVLNDLKGEYGDKYIWSMDIHFPCPSDFEIELANKIKRNDYGYSAGRAGTVKEIDVRLEYEGGVDVEDRSFDER